MAGDPKFDAAQGVPDFPYAQYADMIGLEGIRVDDPDQIGKAWDEALAATRPVVLEAYTDPDVPPIPPHIEFDQVKSLMFAVGKGDSDTVGIIRQGFKDKVEDLLPRSDK